MRGKGKVAKGKSSSSACPPVRLSALQSDLAVCIWIPRFALRCEEHRRHEAAQRATALLAPDDLRRVWQIGSKARQSGVRPGMTVSQAVGLCPSLIVWEPDPIYYDEKFSQLVKALGNVSPAIEPAELGRVFVGVDGLAGLYGELAEQIEAIRAVLGGEGKRETGSEDDERRANSTSPPVCPSAFPPGGDWSGVARLGWARGKFAAWVAATKARPGETFIVTDDERTEFLASQPVGVLRMSPDTHRRLTQLSIRTVKDLTRLPEVAVVSQFGNEGRRLWQLAAGTVVDPVVGRETPEPIVSKMEFPNPVADLAMSAAGLGDLGFGDTSATVLSRLAATFGDPTQDTGFFVGSGSWGECPGEAIRVVQWGPLNIVSRGEAAGAQFISYRLDLKYGGLNSETTDIMTLSGLQVGDTVGQLKEVYGNFNLQFVVDPDAGLVFELRESPTGDILLWGPVDSQDDDATVTGIYSPDSCDR